MGLFDGSGVFGSGLYGSDMTNPTPDPMAQLLALQAIQKSQVPAKKIEDGKILGVHIPFLSDIANPLGPQVGIAKAGMGEVGSVLGTLQREAGDIGAYHTVYNPLPNLPFGINKSLHLPQHDTQLSGETAGMHIGTGKGDLINPSVLTPAFAWSPQIGGGVNTALNGGKESFWQRVADTGTNLAVDPAWLVGGPILKGVAKGAEALGAASKAFESAQALKDAAPIADAAKGAAPIVPDTGGGLPSLPSLPQVAPTVTPIETGMPGAPTVTPIEAGMPGAPAANPLPTIKPPVPTPLPQFDNGLPAPPLLSSDKPLMGGRPPAPAPSPELEHWVAPGVTPTVRPVPAPDNFAPIVDMRGEPPLPNPYSGQGNHMSYRAGPLDPNNPVLASSLGRSSPFSRASTITPPVLAPDNPLAIAKSDAQIASDPALAHPAAPIKPLDTPLPGLDAPTQQTALDAANTMAQASEAVNPGRVQLAWSAPTTFKGWAGNLGVTLPDIPLSPSWKVGSGSQKLMELAQKGGPIGAVANAGNSLKDSLGKGFRFGYGFDPSSLAGRNAIDNLVNTGMEKQLAPVVQSAHDLSKTDFKAADQAIKGTTPDMAPALSEAAAAHVSKVNDYLQATGASKADLAMGKSTNHIDALKAHQTHTLAAPAVHDLTATFMANRYGLSPEQMAAGIASGKLAAKDYTPIARQILDPAQIEAAVKSGHVDAKQAAALSNPDGVITKLAHDNPLASHADARFLPNKMANLATSPLSLTHFDPASLGYIASKAYTVQQKFKKLATGANPGFEAIKHPGGEASKLGGMGAPSAQVASNAIRELRFGKQVGGSGLGKLLPRSVSQAIRTGHAGEDLANGAVHFGGAKGFTMSRADFAKLADSAGFLQQGAHAADFSQGAKTVFRPMRHPLATASNTLQKWGKFNDTTLRMAGFRTFLDKYAREATAKGLKGQAAKDYALGMAAKKNMKATFDYKNLTPLEQRLKLAFPFYTFTRKNIPLQLENLLTHPVRQTLPSRAINQMWSNSGLNRQDYSPQDTNWGIPLGTGANPSILPLKSLAPELDLGLLGKNSLNEATGMISPLAKIPLDLSAGKDISTGIPLPTDKLGKAGWIAEQLGGPEANIAGHYLKPAITGKPPSPTDQFNNLSSVTGFLTGLRPRLENTLANQATEARALTKAQMQAVYQAQDKGLIPPSMPGGGGGGGGRPSSSFGSGLFGSSSHKGGLFGSHKGSAFGSHKSHSSASFKARGPHLKGLPSLKAHSSSGLPKLGKSSSHLPKLPGIHQQKMPSFHIKSTPNHRTKVHF